MAFDRFLIANYNEGLHTDLKPWIIADQAFAALTNAYVWRGRVRKRLGSIYMGTGNSSAPNLDQLLSRLRVRVDTTDPVTGNASGAVPGIKFELGQMFSIGSEIFTVVNDTAGPQNMLKTGATATATFDVSTGNYVFVGSALNTAVYWYPAQPVMGLCNYEVGAINNQPLFGFDTQFAYKFSATAGWQRSFSGTSPFDPIFKGTDINFFWTINWRGTSADQTILFVTNFNSTDGVPPATQDNIWSYDGTTWSTFIPYFLPNGGAVSTGPFVQSARIILPFKNRLILLNTIEYNSSTMLNQSFKNRVRYSFIGSPFAANAWYERGQTDSSGNVAGGAGFIDATTEEAIISAEFIKDRLIVYFDRSTWELVYTGNQVEPFVFQKINTELGSESTFSTVPFDKFVVSIGSTGVHACNGANVERIDNNIPTEIFELQDKDFSNDRICGIRDYYSELVYWAYASDSDTEIYPNRILVYNYKNGSWANFIDSITAFGYYEQQTDTTWETANVTWENANFSWVSGVVQAQFRQVVAGNQEGYTFIISQDISRNAGVLQITNMNQSFGNLILTIINHNLSEYDYIYLENVQGYTSFQNVITQVLIVIDDNTILTSFGESLSGTYSGGGTAARVSNIQILTKQFNPYINKANNFYISKIDFAVEKTDSGAITVDYYPSSTSLSMISEAQTTNTNLGNNVLETSPYDALYYPLEQQQDLLWHSIYFQCYGEFIQLNLYMKPDQMLDPNVALEDFQLEGMILYTNPTGRLG